MEFAPDEDTIVLEDPRQVLLEQLTAADVGELLQLLSAEEAESHVAESRVNVIRNEMQRRIDEAALIQRDELLVDPMVIQDLYQDPSYEDDVHFEPNGEDRDRLSAAENNELYDASVLHADEGVQRITTLSRTQETAWVTYDGFSLVTIRIPAAPQSRDSLRTLTFQFNATEDILQLATLLGNDIPVEAMRERTLGASMKSADGYDYFDAVIPLALEIVQIHGNQEYRLPEVVWDRFGRYSRIQETVDRLV